MSCRSCSAPEEAEEAEELRTPSYQKNHKKQDPPKSRKREKEDQGAKHQILSRSSSEPSQPTFQPTRTRNRWHTEGNTPEHDGTDTELCEDDHADTHWNDDEETEDARCTQEKPAGRDTVIRDNTDAERPEREEEEESTDVIRLKRKSRLIICYGKKRQCLREEWQPDPDSPEKQTHVEKTKQDSSSRAEKPGESWQQTVTGLTWSHSLPSTQTVMVSPLSRTEGPWSRELPLKGGEREAKVQKLAALEKELQGLRRLLDLEVTKTSQGTMTAADSGTDDPKDPTVSTASREVGCQTDVAESSASSSSPALSGLVQVQRAVSGPKEQPELNRNWKEKSESQSRSRVCDSEACDDSRPVQENLRDIRNNVVVLLTALLPQLDLAGISLETTDVDSILQQIIEVNSLKL